MTPVPDVTRGRAEVLSAALQNGVVRLELSPAEISSAIDDGETFILRGAFAEPEMLALRTAVSEWGHKTPAFPRDRSASQAGLNFHRRDDATHFSTMPHIFHQFGFGRLAALSPDLAVQITAIGDALMHLQNALAGTDFRLDGDLFRSKVFRHPCGGGYLVPHRHPYLPQKVGVFLNLSRPGMDYGSGGVRLKAKSGWIDLHESFRCGDILLFRYDTIHDVAAIDPQRPLSWAGDGGFWLFSTEMNEVHRSSHAER